MSMVMRGLTLVSTVFNSDTITIITSGSLLSKRLARTVPEALTLYHLCDCDDKRRFSSELEGALVIKK